MPAARGVGVRQFVDQRETWSTCQQGVEIHLLQHTSLVLDTLSRNHLEAGEQCFGFLSPVGFDDPNDHVGAFLKARSRSGEHFVRFAHARGGTDEDLQSPARFLLCRL
jgi:hypothetical protein